MFRDEICKRDFFLFHPIAALPHDNMHSDMSYADLQFFFVPIEV